MENFSDSNSVKRSDKSKRLNEIGERRLDTLTKICTK